MHTQTETAAQITAAEADYVLTVKANQKSLYRACKRLPWKDIPTHDGVETRNGRRTHRAIKVTTVPTWISFPGASQIAKIRRTTTRRGKKAVDAVYVITSADHITARPAVLAAWVQGHGGIKTGFIGDWNVKHSGVGYVTRFHVRKDFLDDYDVHQVGGHTILEYWIPAVDLPKPNANIIGIIEVTAEYR